MRLADQVRSTPFLIAAGYAGLFTLSVGIVLGFVYWAVDREITGQVRRAIVLDTLPLEEAYRSGGFGRLVEAVGERVRAAPGSPAVYLLADALARPLAGNIAPVARFTGWREFGLFRPGPAPDQRHADVTVPVMAYGLFLDGAFLVVGRDATDVHQTRTLIFDALGLSIGVTLLLALAGGFAMSRASLRRIEAITGTTRAIVAGNLASRVPIGRVRDDLDRLSVNINLMLDRIHDLMESLRQVSSDIAHDLRTPLGRLRQRLENARRQGLGPAELDAVLEAAVTETDAILETFGSLLRIAQIEAGDQRDRFQPVDLSAVARAIVDAYETVAEDRDQTLAGTVATGVIVLGDRHLLTQLLANLVENALRHGPAHTRITVAVTAAGGGRGPVLVVSDTGPGIPAAERDRVFRRFYRLDASRTTPGNGLGLALVKAIADLHGAGIELEDHQPGLRVRLRFPDPPAIGSRSPSP